jgi:hypothetical protein
MSENTPPVTPSPTATPGPRRWRPLLLALAVAVPAAVAGLFFWQQQGPQDTRVLAEA